MQCPLQLPREREAEGQSDDSNSHLGILFLYKLQNLNMKRYTNTQLLVKTVAPNPKEKHCIASAAAAMAAGTRAGALEAFWRYVHTASLLQSPLDMILGKHLKGVYSWETHKIKYSCLGESMT